MTTNNNNNNAQNRSVRSYLIEPAVQLRLATIVVSTLAAQIALVYFFYQYSLKDLFGVLGVVSGASEVAVDLVNGELTKFVALITGGMLFLTIVSCSLIIVQTHRYLGAAYAVTRHIRENMMKGDFNTMLTLRAKDGLMNVRDALNEFSKGMQQVSGGRTKTLKAK